MLGHKRSGFFFETSVTKKNKFCDCPQVRERILGPAHPDTSYYIRYRGAVYADMGHFERCITLWMYALDMQQKMLEPLSPMTQSSLLSFAELFSYMMSEGRNGNRNGNNANGINNNQVSYSQHFIFIASYEWAPKARVFIPFKPFEPSAM